ncbi:MAG: Xaa-Pro peptidase family protein [Dehalococcoidia bacterium]
MLELRAARVQEIAAAHELDAVLLSGSEAVTWLTGCAASAGIASELFAAPPMAVILPDAKPVVIVSEDQAPTYESVDVSITTYPGYNLEPLRTADQARAALDSLLTDGGRVGLDPATVRQIYASKLQVVDVRGDLLSARLIKDADEIARIRRAIQVCDVGQQALRREARPGMSELDLWNSVRLAMETELGEPLELVADFLSGERTAAVEGHAGTRVIGDGDLVLADLAPLVDGYWGDSCATIAVGRAPSTDVRRGYERVREAFDAALGACAPGMTAGELDALMRTSLEYPHHSGHGIGVTVHEEPRIVPENDLRLAPGMIIALEPALYAKSFGIRIEQVVLVTDVGAEVISKHEVCLEP